MTDKQQSWEELFKEQKVGPELRELCPKCKKYTLVTWWGIDGRKCISRRCDYTEVPIQCNHCKDKAAAAVWDHAELYRRTTNRQDQELDKLKNDPELNRYKERYKALEITLERAENTIKELQSKLYETPEYKYRRHIHDLFKYYVENPQSAHGEEYERVREILNHELDNLLLPQILSTIAEDIRHMEAREQFRVPVSLLESYPDRPNIWGGLAHFKTGGVSCQ